MKIQVRYCLAAILTLTALHKFGYSQVGKALPAISGMETAARHPLICDKPAPDFFEGALLGNGGLGVNVTTRPDAVVLYFGHNNVWDIRLAENHRQEIGTFDEVFEKVKNIPATYGSLNDDAWFRKYSEMAGDNYRKPYPRPFPCGSVILGLDRRDVQVLGHKLDISNGLCSITLQTAAGKLIYLKLFVDMLTDQLHMQLVDVKGRAATNVFKRIRVIPDPSTPGDIPAWQPREVLADGQISFRQVLPFSEPENGKSSPENPKDKAFRLAVNINQQLKKTVFVAWDGSVQPMNTLEAALPSDSSFSATVTLQEGLATAIPVAAPLGSQPNKDSFDGRFALANKVWAAYWAKSTIKLGDSFLEETWYRNLYFFNCAAKAGITCPGLFANWSYNNIGTAWHGDYHINYNTQQPFWMTFSSNHLEKNLPYVELIRSLLPVSKKWAAEYYKLPGAYFPHSAYPVEMTMNPYPLPDWGWEVSETPWAVQGLWWHYLYSGDKDFLKNKAFEPIKAACQFLAAYMKRPDAHGSERWNDQKYHIFPTVAPELFALQPGFRFNYDGVVDLSLTKFIFKAYRQAVHELGIAQEEKKLLDDIAGIQANFPDYPTATSARYGKVMVAVPGESANTVYNVPDALFAVFPGEDYGLHSDAATKQLLKNTYLNQQNEGGNDLVFINMQAARIGRLNLDDFKRQIRYCLLPNGTATDMVTQVKGRYNDQTDFGYMGRMGIWFENFALPAVINECLMQSYNGTIRLFPNWPKEKDAEFSDLRAAGAFLVSASQKNGKVTTISIKSEKGGALRLIVPWGRGGFIKRSSGQSLPVTGNLLTINTKPGEFILLRP